MESLHSDGSATYLLIIWVEKIIPLTMKSKQKPYPSIVFLSIVKLGYAGVYIFFLSLNQNIDRGYSLEPPRRGGSNVYPKSMF